MCLAESLFCSNNILNTAFFFFFSPNRKFSEKTKGSTGPSSKPKNRNRPKPRPKPKQTETDGFSTISVGFGWDFYKPKISVSVGRIKKKGPNRTDYSPSWYCLWIVLCLLVLFWIAIEIWGYAGFFPNILIWILQEFMDKEIRDTILGSFYEFYIKIKNGENGLPLCKNLFWCNVLDIFF